MSTPRWAHDPLSGEGARVVGGRFNRVGRAALYLSADPQTAYAEYTQNLFDRPGLMCGYDVDLEAVADLTDAATLATWDVSAESLSGRWLGVGVAPGQALAERLIGEGLVAARYSSAQRRDGINLVVWSWNGAPGRSVALIDRMGEAPRVAMV